VSTKRDQLIARLNGLANLFFVGRVEVTKFMTKSVIDLARLLLQPSIQAR